MSESILVSDRKTVDWHVSLHQAAKEIGFPESILTRVENIEVRNFQMWVAPVLDIFDGDIMVWDQASVTERVLFLVGYHGKVRN